MDGIVSEDTSAVHLGAALNKPVVALFNAIAKELRIRYSPTVTGVQIAFRGRRCQAPCGRSKRLAELRATVAGGRPISWRFGYVCDEAVDIEALFAAAREDLAGISPDDDVDARLHQIRQSLAERMAAGGTEAPCWRALDLEEVRRLVRRVVLGRDSGEGRRSSL